MLARKCEIGLIDVNALLAGYNRKRIDAEAVVKMIRSLGIYPFRTEESQIRQVDVKHDEFYTQGKKVTVVVGEKPTLVLKEFVGHHINREASDHMKENEDCHNALEYLVDNNILTRNISQRRSLRLKDEGDDTNGSTKSKVKLKVKFSAEGGNCEYEVS